MLSVTRRPLTHAAVLALSALVAGIALLAIVASPPTRTFAQPPTAAPGTPGPMTPGLGTPAPRTPGPGTPGPGPGPGTPGPNRGSDEQFRRYGTRYVLTSLGAGPSDPGGPAPAGAASAVLHVANNGEKPTRLLVVELADPATDLALDCPSGLPVARIAAVHCPDVLVASGSMDLQLTSSGSRSAIVYSLNAVTITNACTAFEPVRAGTQPLDAWEQMVWNRSFGQPVAVTLDAALEPANADEAGLALTSFVGRTSLDLVGPPRPSVSQGGGQGGQMRPNLRQQIMPLAFTGKTGARVRVVNTGSQCQTVQTQAAASIAVIDCTLPPTATLRVPAYGAVDMPRTNNGAPQAIGVNGWPQLAAAAEVRDAGGWWSYGAPTLGGQGPNGLIGSGDLAFPLAVGPFTGTHSTVWVTNQHPTATAQIDLLFWDGNGKLLKAYTDRTPICAGGSRSYDVESMVTGLDPSRVAVPVPLGGGQAPMPANMELPPLVSLRVQSTNLQLADAPPIAGMLVLTTDMGVTAYPGMAVSNDMQAIQGPRANQVRVTTVIPNFKINYGSPPESTFVAGINLADPAANVMIFNLYDQSGKLVAEDLGFLMGGGLTGATFVDMGLIAGRRASPASDAIPDNFVGTATIRGSDAGPFGQFGVVAIPHRMEDLPVRRLRPPMPPRTPMPPPFLPVGLGEGWSGDMFGKGVEVGDANRGGKSDRVGGTFGWAAADGRHSDQTGRKEDRLTSITGLLVPRWLDANAPTATPRPTFTPTSTGAEPTPTVLATAGGRIWLPVVWARAGRE